MAAHEKTIGDATVFELIEAAKFEAEQRRIDATGGPAGNAAREFSIVVTALEDAQMRYTRGIAMMLGVFRPVDLESVDAIADRRAFLDSVEQAQG